MYSLFNFASASSLIFQLHAAIPEEKKDDATQVQRSLEALLLFHKNFLVLQQRFGNAFAQSKLYKSSENDLTVSTSRKKVLDIFSRPHSMY